jgi:DnaK suppressor protein
MITRKALLLDKINRQPIFNFHTKPIMARPKNAMKNLESRPFKKRLLSLRARLRGDVSAMAELALGQGKTAGGSGSSPSNHMADKGTDQYEQEFTLSLVENDEETLQWIAAALDRIELGVYGACEQCERKIPKQRLNVLPFTAYCVKCASEIQTG